MRHRSSSLLAPLLALFLSATVGRSLPTSSSFSSCAATAYNSSNPPPCYFSALRSQIKRLSLFPSRSTAPQPELAGMAVAATAGNSS
uniref:Secreted protein n=1 Tax=Arundo donax TaxID=35708 RepID=A0A0A9AJH2_ARUDO